MQHWRSSCSLIITTRVVSSVKSMWNDLKVMLLETHRTCWDYMGRLCNIKDVLVQFHLFSSCILGTCSLQNEGRKLSASLTELPNFTILNHNLEELRCFWLVLWIKIVHLFKFLYDTCRRPLFLGYFLFAVVWFCCYFFF